MGALVEITEIVAIALTLGAGSLLQSAVGFGFGLFVDRDSWVQDKKKLQG